MLASSKNTHKWKINKNTSEEIFERFPKTFLKKSLKFFRENTLSLILKVHLDKFVKKSLEEFPRKNIGEFLEQSIQGFLKTMFVKFLWEASVKFPKESWRNFNSYLAEENVRFFWVGERMPGWISRWVLEDAFEEIYGEYLLIFL